MHSLLHNHLRLHHPDSVAHRHTTVPHTLQVATFLRYRDTNYINARSQWDLQPENLRRALLGAIRYGKPLVLDMGHADVFSSVCESLDAIQLVGPTSDGVAGVGLSNVVLSKDILRPEV